VIEITCPTEADTRAVGRRLAALCRPGDVVILHGRLGAGKTAFAGGLAEGLAVDEQVTSPSFVLVRRYDSGFLPLIHADVYRLGSLAEFDDLDVLDEASEGVLVIEWGEAVASELPADRLTVVIEVADSEVRTITLDPMGEWESRNLIEVAG
jgi:tRNA threonylcarbamoyladenosine biosynthesis protein TsaE